MAKTSIISLCWNHCDDITAPFVNQILQTEGDFELILVNNGSTDGTKKFLQRVTDPRVSVINSPQNLGFGRGNNLGYQHTTGEYICFINNDVVFENPDWLSRLVGNSKGCLVGPELVKDNLGTMFRNKPAPYLNGWCVLGEKKLFDNIYDNGVFDPGFGLAYFEDVDLSVRAVSAGYSLKEVENTGLIHLGSKSSVDQLNIGESYKKAQAYYRNKMTVLDLDKRKTKRIVFFASGVRYPFIDSDYEGKGVGGAEASLILLTRELAQKGYQVEIYNNTILSGTFGGVEYRNINEFYPSDYCDVFVLFRSYSPVLKYVNAVHRLFWSCDQTTDSPWLWNGHVFPQVDTVVAISEYHKKYLLDNYKVSRNKVMVLDLGINWPDYENLPDKQPGKCIYCSVPARGLSRLAKLAPLIRERVPNFELIVTSDYRLWGLEDPENSQYRDELSRYEYVKFLGKIGREELVSHQLTSQVMAYPCNYEECFCISVMECIAAGAVPVTTLIGAIPTTLSESGIGLSNSDNEGDYDTRFVDSVVRLLTDSETRNKYLVQGRVRAKKYAWSQKARGWVDLFTQLEKPKSRKMVKCKHCDKEVNNDYLLNRHVAAKHGVDKLVAETAPESPFELNSPQKLLIKTSKFVEVGVNGKWYSGKELLVDSQFVDAVLFQLREAYGEDIVI